MNEGRSEERAGCVLKGKTSWYSGWLFMCVVVQRLGLSPEARAEGLAFDKRSAVDKRITDVGGGSPAAPCDNKLVY